MDNMRQSILTLLCSIRCLASHHSPLSIVTLSVGLNLRELYICHSFFIATWLPAIISGLVEAAQSQLQTEFQSFLSQRCSGQVTFQDGSLLPSRRCLLGDRKWPAFHTFFLKTEVWWMDYHKDMVMPCNLHGSPTLRSLQCHYTPEIYRNFTYQKWLYLKGFTFSKPSFLGSPAVRVRWGFSRVAWTVCRSWW